jgi:hypothetical protein
MAQKKFKVTQKATVNGQLKKASFVFIGAEADFNKFKAELLGDIEVWELNATLSVTGKEGDNNTAWNELNKVSMSGPKSTYSTLKPYEGSIITKNSTCPDTLEPIFKETTPFEALPTAKPTSVRSTIVGAVVSAKTISKRYRLVHHKICRD